jgi:hypothetical protein
MAGVYGEINSKIDYHRVLNEATIFVRTLERNPHGTSHGTSHAIQRIQKELGAMKRWTANGRTPTDVERYSIDIGLTAVREFDGATDKLAEFAQRLCALNNYFEAWPTDHAAASATDDDFWNDETDASLTESAKYPNRADEFFDAESSVTAEVNKHKWRDFWNFVRKYPRQTAAMPFLAALAIYWLVKKIAPHSDLLLSVAIILVAVTVVWMLALLVYMYFTIVRFIFARCPKCHRFYVWRLKCGSCGVKRAW